MPERDRFSSIESIQFTAPIITNFFPLLRARMEVPSNPWTRGPWVTNGDYSFQHVHNVEWAFRLGTAAISGAGRLRGKLCCPPSLPAWTASLRLSARRAGNLDGWERSTDIQRAPRGGGGGRAARPPPPPPPRRGALRERRGRRLPATFCHVRPPVATRQRSRFCTRRILLRALNIEATNFVACPKY